MSDNQVKDRNPHPQTDANGVPMAPNPDAHMPPQPGGDPVWANTWNPETDEWVPSNEQHSIFGVGEPSHGDAELARPMVNVPGRPETYEEGGGTPDARPNLLDAVRGQGVPLSPPTQRIEHVIKTQEYGPDSDLVRGRVVAVVNNNVQTMLLEENANRKRALIKVVTSAAVILIQPTRQGSPPMLTGAPVLPGAFYPLATGDPIHEVKSGAGVEAYGVLAAGTVLVAIWEELQQPGQMPGLT